MQSVGYSPNSSSANQRTIRTEIFTTNKAGTGFAKNEVLRRQVIYDLIADAEVAGTLKWYNVSQGNTVLGATPDAADITSKGTDAILGSETLAVADTAVALASVASGANAAVIHVLDADIIFTLTGTNPTGDGSATPVGIRQASGQTFTLDSPQEVAGLKAVRLDNSNSARLYVEYHLVES